jgi:hypothetical protein
MQRTSDREHSAQNRADERNRGTHQSLPCELGASLQEIYHLQTQSLFQRKKMKFK